MLQDAVAKAQAAAAASAASPWTTLREKEKNEIRSLLFDMKHSISHGTKYEAPPRADMPPLPKHQYEYEVCALVGFPFLFF